MARVDCVWARSLHVYWLTGSWSEAEAAAAEEEEEETGGEGNGSSSDEGGDDEPDDDDELDEEDGGAEDEDDEDEFTRNMTEEPGSDSGCTAVVALVRPHAVYVANAGDSRCIVCRAGKAVELSFDHKPEDEAEMVRITAAGGKVSADGGQGECKRRQRTDACAFCAGDAGRPR